MLEREDGKMNVFQYPIWNKKYFDGFPEKMDALYEKSMNYYHNRLDEGVLYSLDDKEMDEEAIRAFFPSLEYYFVSLFELGLVTRHNFPTILEQIKSIRLFKVLPYRERNYYGLTTNREISIDSSMYGIFGFSKEEFRELIIAHELCHIINFHWIDERDAFCDKLYQVDSVKRLLNKMNLGNPRYLRAGFSLLDEVMAQEVAEEITYKLAKKKRPEKEIRNDKEIFNHQEYSTNFLLYGEMQEFGEKFARELSFLNVKDSDNGSQVVQKLARESFDKDFIKKFEMEFMNHPEKVEFLAVLLACMGRIKEATYHRIGLSDDNKGLDVTSYVRIFNGVIQLKDKINKEEKTK